MSKLLLTFARNKYVINNQRVITMLTFLLGAFFGISTATVFFIAYLVQYELLSSHRFPFLKRNGRENTQISGGSGDDKIVNINL